MLSIRPMQAINPRYSMNALLVTGLLAGLSGCGGGSSSNPQLTHMVSSTENYQVAYSVEADQKQGRSQFTLQLKNKQGELLVGVTPEISPMMAMVAGHMHGTPHEGCTMSNASGESLCTVYYLMASEMNGVQQGTWSITVSINGETIEITPIVSMPMGDTVRTTLKGSDMDTIPTASMGGMSMMADMAMTGERRTYYLFNDGLEGDENGYAFNLFVAAKDSMSSYPAVATDNTLSNGDNDINLDSVLVEVSANDSEVWVSADELGNGHFTVSDLTGLDGAENPLLKVRLTVNGEQKTSDGESVGTDNGYATFFVSP